MTYFQHYLRFHILYAPMFLLPWILVNISGEAISEGINLLLLAACVGTMLLHLTRCFDKNEGRTRWVSFSMFRATTTEEKP
jgi:hypothetical protein